MYLRHHAALSLLVLTWTAHAALSRLKVVPVAYTPNNNATRAYRIVDADGREVVLRGSNLEFEERNLAPPNGMQRPVNASAYAGGACPTNLADYQEPPICEVEAGKGKWAQNSTDLSRNDIAQMRAVGFNFIRLCLSWSELEAVPGVYSSEYIDRVAQIVGWAREQDIYVLLDLHEDLYSRFIVGNASGPSFPPYLTPADGQDGAPPWAVLMDGWPSLALFGVGNLNLGMMKAFQNFWDNTVVDVPQGAAPGPGLQDHYIGAIAALLTRFINEPTVLGVEIMNEPQPGLEIDPFQFGDTLFGFYARVIQAVTGIRDGKPTCSTTTPINTSCAYPDLGVHDASHMVFCEPSSIRNLLDFAPENATAFTSFPNVVYSPHVYTNSFTQWSPPSYDFAYETATTEAQGRKGAIVVTEFGGALSDAAPKIGPTIASSEKYKISGASVWAWKSNCVGLQCNVSSWTIFDPVITTNSTGPLPAGNGPLRPYMELILSRPHLRGLVGDLIASAYNITTKTYLLQANISAAAAASGTTTELYIPRGVSGSPAVSGAATLVNVTSWPDGSRSVFAQPSAAGGLFNISISHAGTHVEVAGVEAAVPGQAEVVAPWRDILKLKYGGGDKGATAFATSSKLKFADDAGAALVAGFDEMASAAAAAVVFSRAMGLSLEAVYRVKGHCEAWESAMGALAASITRDGALAAYMESTRAVRRVIQELGLK